MPTSLEVEKQQFEFGDCWTVALKYDNTEFHQKEATKLQGMIDGVPHSTKAVDVVGLHNVSGLLLLEAKDFRSHRIANKLRIEQKEVLVEVAVKARDTLAALVGAARKPVTEFPSIQLATALGQGNNVAVVLWLEDDTFTDESKAKVTLGALNQKLKSLLTSLNVRTLVLSSAIPNRINHMTVTDRPGAGQPNH